MQIKKKWKWMFLFIGILFLRTISVHAWQADNGNGTFTNPLFYDEFSDPDLIRVGDDFYLTGTTMHSMPWFANLAFKRPRQLEFPDLCL